MKDVIEGFIEVEGNNPILITALHGFGSDRFKDLTKRIKKLGLYDMFKDLIPVYSGVDLFTGEIAFKVGVLENCWVILPTASKVDEIEGLSIPYYNLNKRFARITPFWSRVKEIIENHAIEIILDIHGTANVKNWPDFCISCGGYTTASKRIVTLVANVLSSLGYRVEIDKPYSGGAFIRHFGKPPKIEALALEIKRCHRFIGSKIIRDLRFVVKALLEVVKK